MNYTDEQFNALAPYEDNFRTALEANWTRRIPIEGQKLIRQTYQDATGDKVPFNTGCATCVINILRRAGKRWFQDKTERETIAAATNLERRADGTIKHIPPQKPEPASKKASKPKTTKK